MAMGRTSTAVGNASRQASDVRLRRHSSHRSRQGLWQLSSRQCSWSREVCRDLRFREREDAGLTGPRTPAAVAAGRCSCAVRQSAWLERGRGVPESFVPGTEGR